MSPAVTVCIPSYNGERHIAETIESVLSQSFTDLELVVCDDSSTDGTVGIVGRIRDPRLRLIVNDVNVGPTANWNAALSAASSPFVKLLCGDDILVPDCLERQVDQLIRHPEATFVAGRRRIIDENGSVIVRSRGLGRMEGLVDGDAALRAAVRSGSNPFGEPLCVLMRRSAIDQAGWFSDSAAYMIDLDYWCRLLEVGPFFAHRATVGAFRVVATSWSNDIGWRQAAETRELYRALRHRHPQVVRRADFAVGALRAGAMNMARLALYAGLGARERWRRRNLSGDVAIPRR